MRRILATTFSLLILATAAHPIELSLEENRAERGSIGYIDMQRLFKTFPETVRSKENFEEVVRQAEEQLNLRKAEILRLRNELSQLKIEREFIARNPVVDLSTGPVNAPKEPEAPKEPPKPLPPAPAPPPQAPPTPNEPPQAQSKAAQLPGMVSTETMKTPGYQKPQPLTINIPGVSTAPIVVQPPEQHPPEAAQAAPKVSTVAFTPPPVPPAPAKAAAQAVTAPINAALVEIDGKIAVKARELAQKEQDFKDQQASAEKNLLDLESRKTEILLGKIYKAVQQVARKEGISVVVDKGSILYGHDAVDLTEKTLKFLKGEQQ